MLNLKQIVAVFTGGGLGSLLRFFLAGYVRGKLPVHFPFGTFLINIIACFVLGCLVGFAEQRHIFSVELRLFLMVGFCGGFSTFSAFSLESVQLLQTGQYAVFAVYIFFSVLLCIAAIFIGLSIASNFVNSVK